MARNVLWIMADQHAWWASGCYGSPIARTPRIDALAAEGIRFDTAYTPAPVCVPSRLSALCGLTPRRTGMLAGGAPLSHRVATAAHLFRAQGHVTGFIGKLHPVEPQPHGFDYYVDMGHWYDALGPQLEVFARGMDARNSGCGLPWIDAWYRPHPWRGEPLRPGLPAVLDEEDHFEAFIARCCDTFLRRHGDEPFFLMASLLKPHFPFACPPAWHAPFAREAMPRPLVLPEACPVPAWRRWWRPPAEAMGTEAAAYAAGYHAATWFMDAMVGRILDALADTGHAQDTLVVYTADHGEMLFEHGFTGKFVFYEGSARVPLIVRDPGSPRRGVATPALADLIDLLPTSLRWAGLPVPAGLDGVDLGPVLADPAATPRAAATSELGAHTMRREGSLKLSRYEADGAVQWQLFDLAQDPREECDLSRERAADPAVVGLRERLLASRASA